MTDLCSGWRAGGLATSSIAAGHGVPVQNCPPAPSLVGEDVLGWHDMEVLEEDWMRRRRLIDVSASADDRFFIFAMFRDTVGDGSGAESVLHEYAVRAVGVGNVLTALEAEPHSLPFPECPGAAAEVSALAGIELSALADAVPDTLVGIASCTHLNDLMRALGGVERVGLRRAGGLRGLLQEVGVAGGHHAAKAVAPRHRGRADQLVHAGEVDLARCRWCCRWVRS